MIVTDEVPLLVTTAPLAAGRDRQRALGHRQGRGLDAAEAVDVADRQPGVLQMQVDLLGRAVMRRRRHVATGASLTAVMSMVAVALAGQRAAAGVAVVVDRQASASCWRRACRCCRCRLTVLVPSVLSSALSCAIVPVIITDDVPLPLTMAAPLVPAAPVSVPSPTDSVTVSMPELPSTSLDRQAGVLQRQVGLLGRAVMRGRRDRRRRVVHRRDVDGRPMARRLSAPPPVLPLSLIASVSVALALGVSVLSI